MESWKSIWRQIRFYRYKAFSQNKRYSQNWKKIPSLLGFLVMKIRKIIQSMFQNVVKINILIYYWYVKYYLQGFRTTDALKCHIKDCFKINGKQRVKMPSKGEYDKFKNYERKIK